MERYGGKDRKQIIRIRQAQGKEEGLITPNSLTFEFYRRLPDGYLFKLRGVDKDLENIDLKNPMEIRKALLKLLGASGKGEVKIEKGDSDIAITEPGGPDPIRPQEQVQEQGEENERA